MIVRHPSGRRLYVARRRWHHGTWAVLMAPIALWLAWKDREDWKEWLWREVLP